MMKQDTISFLLWYSANNLTESAAKVKANYDSYAERIGYSDGFFEYQNDEIKGFRKYFETHPDEVDSEYWKALEMYEGALNKFKNHLNLSTSESVDQDQNELPEIELKTQKEQIRLLLDLGVLDHLIEKYPATLKNNQNQLAILVGQILKLNRASVQPTINALYSETTGKNYPKETPRTKAIIAQLKANESS